MHEAADTRERLLRLAIPYPQIEVILKNDETQQVMLNLPQVRLDSVVVLVCTDWPANVH